MKPLGQSTLLQEVSLDLVNLSAMQGSEQERQTTATSGRKCAESLENLDHLGCLLKMLTDSSVWLSPIGTLSWKTKQQYAKKRKRSSKQSGKTLKQSGTNPSQLLYQLAVSVPRTDDTGCSLWATPSAADAVGSHGGGQGKSLRIEKNVCYTVEKYGTGAINVDGCRIGEGERVNQPAGNKAGGNSLKMSVSGMPQDAEPTFAIGRFPANCVTTDEEAWYSPYFNVSPQEVSKKASKKDRNSDWAGNEIDLELRKAGGMQGRNDGSLGSVTYNRNTHPTVKPTDLMAWLVRLVTPPGGIVLDPYAGSGSTLVSAKREGFGFIGIEQEEEYVKIIEARTGESREITDEEFEALLA